MDVFMHVSRLMQFPDGHILDLSKGLNFHQHSWINLLGGFVDRGFVKHLEQLFEQGISKHGSNYLYHGLKDMICYSSWALEMCFEHVRYTEFTEKPSRLQSAFAWRDLAEAQKALRSNEWAIYAVQPLDAVAFLDMKLITGDRKLFGGAEDNARAYWGGKKPETPEYTPLTEVVMKCPVKILEKVM